LQLPAAGPGPPNDHSLDHTALPNRFESFKSLSALHPLSLVDMLHATSGGFGTQWFPFLSLPRLFGVFCLPGLWSLHFVSFSLPFLGAFFL